MGDGARPALVIDTNIALDLLVFEDPATDTLREWLSAGSHEWLATEAMREELRRVLCYPQIARRLQERALPPETVMAQWDDRVRLLPVAPKAPYRCKDEDDQKFIDLAVAQGAALLSKDKAVLCMTRRLARVGVSVHRGVPPPSPDEPLHLPTTFTEQPS